MISRYSLQEMKELWSDLTRYRTWLEVELAACRAMEESGQVPRGTADKVAVHMDRLDPGRIEEIEQTTRHDVIAFLTHVEELAGPDARLLHLGMTSSDVLDTAGALLMTRACDLILEKARLLQQALRDRSLELRSVPMVGRTHGIHAEPTTVGLSFARFYAATGRHIQRIQRARQTVAVGKIAGAVGVYGHLAPEVEQKALDMLGLRPETVPTQIVQRDRHAELLSAFALAACGVEEMALTVRGWQRTEVGEAQEAFLAGQKGSSAMPHKKNPIQSENLCGLARLVRSYVQPALENVALWHERDISHSSVERLILPDASTALHFMLHRACGLMGRLVIDVGRMRQNLDLTHGLIFSEAVLLSLVRKGLMRKKAYELVQGCALRSSAQRSFKNELMEDPSIRELLSEAEIEGLFDLENHLRHTDVIFSRAFENGEDDPSA